MGKFLQVISLFLLVGFFLSCRGQITEANPIHLNPNMDMQSKYKPQRLAQNVPENTIPWGRYSVTIKNAKREDFLKSEGDVYLGVRKKGGDFIQKIPGKYKINTSFVKRGQERFDIYCAICHDRAGTGLGTVAKRGIGIVPNLHEQRFKTMPDGEIFNTISMGKGSMPSYARQIEVDDRWAIIAYIRALQSLDIDLNNK